MADDKLSQEACRNCGGPVEIMAQKNTGFCCGLCEKFYIKRKKEQQ